MTDKMQMTIQVCIFKQDISHITYLLMSNNHFTCPQLNKEVVGLVLTEPDLGMVVGQYWVGD